MSNQVLNIDREFIKWFYEQPYPDVGSNRSQVFVNSIQFTPNAETRDYWMRQAFMAGARSVANDTRCVLNDWACACAGLDPELLAPDEVFERAETNLQSYYDTVFKE